MKVYISGCTRTMSKYIVETSSLLRRSGHEAYFHKQNTDYDPSLLQQADATVFVLPDLSWETPLRKLSQGSLKELLYCLNNKKDFYIAYKTFSGVLKIYAAEITEELCIRGISATYMNLDIMDGVLDHPTSHVTYTIPKSTERFY